jgi:hypothetical protein
MGIYFLLGYASTSRSSPKIVEIGPLTLVDYIKPGRFDSSLNARNLWWDL